MTNTSVRERFGIAEKNASVASRLLNEAVEAGRIVVEDPEAGTRARSYLPFWAVTGRRLEGDCLMANPQNASAAGRQTSKPLMQWTSLLPKLLDGCLMARPGVLPIQGPPGSGKTYVGARVIAELARTKRIGVTAVSHKVIDNLLEEIRDASPGGRLRLVHKHSEEPPQRIEYVDGNADTLKAVRAGTVVGATVWLWSSDEAVGALDYLFIDEAGQMALAHALAAARAARNVVLLGDPQQLEPTQGAHPKGASFDPPVAALVHVLCKNRATLADDQGLFLERTWRLHPDLCAFTSELYYEGHLAAIDALARQRLEGDTPFAGAGLFLIEVPHEGNQSRANEEIDAVERIVRHLLAGTRWTDQEGRTRALEPSDILVVAPYNAHVSALRRTLAPLGVTRVGTVDKFQGQEAPIVLYSCTASSPQDAPRGMAFLYDPHRFNVATSRARCAVVVVAIPSLFDLDCRTPEQMRWANSLCRYKEAARQARGFASDVA